MDPLDWAETPQAVRILVLALQQQVVALTERVSALEERTHKTSRNSSQLPSSDPPSAPAHRKGERSVRRHGGPRGHRGTGRPLVPPEQVDQVVDAMPTACGQCGHLAVPSPPSPSDRSPGHGPAST